MQIKKIILNLYNKNDYLKSIINSILYRKDYIRISKLIRRHKNRNVWFLVLTPRHGNLGDHAITQAEIQILRECQIKYIELSGRDLETLQYFHKLNILNGSPIMVNGGGNLGSLWPQVEKMIRDLIVENPESKITIMPSTIYYDNTEGDLKSFEESKRLYNAHKDLLIYAREKNSYDKMRSAYNKVLLAPDMVMSLDKSIVQTVRKGCLICLRSDREKTLSESVVKEMIEIVKEIYGDRVGYTDTVVDYSVSSENRVKELEKKFGEFRSAEIAITDRLHGMIFAAITGTPCVVLNSKSPKIEGCYDWLRELKYIYFIDSADSLRDKISKILTSSAIHDTYFYHNEHLKDKFSDIKYIIKNR